MKKLAIILALIISFISYGQGRRTVSALGVEEIQYGTIAKYIYDGNPFNDNEKKLGIEFTRNYSFRNRIDIKTVDFTISKSDVSPEKILINKSLFNWRINGSKDSIAAFFEFIFDNDKSTYFKLDATSVKKLKLLDNDLFLKFKKHKIVAIRASTKRISAGNRRQYSWSHIDYMKNLSGFSAAMSKYLEIEAPTQKNKNLYKVSNGLANVNPFNLEKYIDKFILDAKINHNIDLSYVNKRNRLIIFRELKGKTIATASKMNNDNDVFVKVDPENWNAANQSKRWYIIYHELGHDILNLEHGECGAMMNATTSGNYTWGRLEKDKNTMFESYKLK